jgi:DNA-binding response OmpR family regulator
LKRLNILLVDDELEFITALARRLEMRDFQVEIETNGEDAITKLEEGVFDVLILDVLMPDIGGIDVLRRIRSSSIKTKIILLSGHGSTKDGIEGMHLGASDYLVKPVDIEELTQRILKISNE